MIASRATAALAAALFLLNALLNAPLFFPGETVFRDSIEGGYAGMSRFLATHPNPWGWDPYAYCGLPSQFLYLPAIHYAAAALAWTAALPPEHAYRIVAALAGCLGPVSLFLFAAAFLRSRRWALLAALAYTLFSPSYGLIRTIMYDRGVAQLPWRIQALAKYGEAPHNAGLTLIPLALLALWAAANKRTFPRIFAAAALLAAVALLNWVGALALAFSVLLFLLACFVARRPDGFRVWPVIAAGALGYLLAAFWLTPTFVQTTALNWPSDAFGYAVKNRQYYSLAALGAALTLTAAAFRLWLRDFYLAFTTLALLFFGWIAVVFYSFGVDTLPESRRYALEFELFLFLALFGWLRLGYAAGGVSRFCAAGAAIAMLGAGAGQAAQYVTQGWAPWRPKPPETTPEFRAARWLQQAGVRGRVMASGGLRFRMNTWFLIPQTGGGFESGVRNRVPLHMAYQIRTGLGSKPGEEAADAVLQLRALGVEYVVVNGPGSKEHYRDFRNPEKFEGVLEPVHRDGDDRIYRAPFTSLAHLVRPAELPPHAPIHGYWNVLRPYVDAMDDPARPRLAVRDLDPGEFEISGSTPPGMLIALRMTYDPGWRATQNGRAVKIAADQLGFMTLHPAGDGPIRLTYAGTMEPKIAAAISASAWLAALGALAFQLLRQRRATRKPLLDAGAQ